MGKEMLQHENNGYEREDIGAGGILAFLAGLAVAGILIHFILLGMYKYLDAYDRAHQAPPNPLVKESKANLRRPTSQDAEEFPQPRLEVDERGQIDDRRMQEEETLHSYGWIDRKAGIVRIPIERAMALVAERGLPTEPAAAAVSAKPKPQGPGKGSKK